MRPPRLRDYRFLPARRSGDAAGLVERVLPRGFGELVVIEEGVAVGGAVVGRGAEFRVLQHHGKGVDCDHGALVACAAEDAAGGVDGVDDVSWFILALVDELVADGDGVENGPVTSYGGGGVADVMQAVGEVMEVEDTCEDF